MSIIFTARPGRRLRHLSPVVAVLAALGFLSGSLAPMVSAAGAGPLVPIDAYQNKNVTISVGTRVQISLQETLTGAATHIYSAASTNDPVLHLISEQRLPGSPGQETYVAQFVALTAGTALIAVTDTGSGNLFDCRSLPEGPPPTPSPSVTCNDFALTVAQGLVDTSTPPIVLQETDAGKTLIVPSGTSFALSLTDTGPFRWNSVVSLDPSVVSLQSVTALPSPCPILIPPPKVPATVLGTSAPPTPPPFGSMCVKTYHFLATGSGLSITTIAADGQQLCGVPPPYPPFTCSGRVLTFTVVVNGRPTTSPSVSPSTTPSATPTPHGHHHHHHHHHHGHGH